MLATSSKHTNNNVSKMIPGAIDAKGARKITANLSYGASIYAYSKPVLLQECNLCKNVFHVLTVHDTMCKGKGLK